MVLVEAWEKIPPSIRIHLIYNKHKIQGYKAINNPFRTICVPVDRINLMMSTSRFGKRMPIYGIVSGNWDRRAYPFTNNAIYDMFVEHFTEGVAWEETNQYKKAIQKIKNGEKVGGLDTSKQTVKKYNKYLNYIDGLYSEIKTKGYKSQTELSEEDDFVNKESSSLNEIRVLIGREGEFICKAGKHRLTIAKILNIKTVPVWVKLRHTEWQKVRENVLKQKQSSISKKKVSHPDLQDLL